MHEGPAEERDALQIALAGYFAAQQLEAQSAAYLYASALPSGALWLHSWHPLPDLVAWFVSLGWALCAIVAANLAVIAATRRSQARAAAPDANRIARVHFLSSNDLPPTSLILFGLSAVASGVLCIHGLMPRMLQPDVVASASKAWTVLLFGAGLNRLLERF
jgi:hypothetical protein